MSQYGLVFSGGGARGAYEAGVMYYMRTQLPAPVRNVSIPIFAGTSVGSINACICAINAQSPRMQGEELKRLWLGLKQKDVYNRSVFSLGKLIVHTMHSGFVNLTRGVAQSDTHFSGILDTSPLKKTLDSQLNFHHIENNIKQGFLQALSIAGTNVDTGNAELFLQKHPSLAYTGDYIVHESQISSRHIMASSAIPIVFPAETINQQCYIDGGLRLNTPLAPAIQLGADKIMVVSVQHRQTQSTAAGSGTANLGQTLSRVFNSIFLDKIRSDYDQTTRINRIIEWGEAVYGPNFLKDINQHLDDANITGDIANRGLKKLEILRITPSIDCGEIFRECFNKTPKSNFSLFERSLVRILDIDPSSGFDFLSYITFMPTYIQALFDLGVKDAHEQRLKICEFFT